MANSGQQLQAALKKSQAQLQALRTQFARLQGALNAAHQLVAKWSRPMMLAMAVRFLKAKIDRDELNEVSDGTSSTLRSSRFLVLFCML